MSWPSSDLPCIVWSANNCNACSASLCHTHSAVSTTKTRIHQRMMSGSFPLAFSASLPLQIRSARKQLSRKSPSIAMVLQVGQHVRVTKPLVMYHYPKKKNVPVHVEGFEGVIVRDVSAFQDTEMTATAPYIVEFPDHPKFKAHFQESELEVI